MTVMGMFSWLRRKDRTANPEMFVPTFAYGFGRRHLNQHLYMLPKDIEESGRLDFQHFMLRYAFHGNYVAPLKQPHDILDVGCGTGRWAMEMAQQFPRANVIGMDVAPSTENAVEILGFGLDQRPENYVFVEGDVIKGLAFPDQSFDFVHMRLLFTAIPVAKWPLVVSELARVTRPGGWVQLLEAYPIPNGGPAMKHWQGWVEQFGKNTGIDFNIGEHLGELLQQAGLRNVRQQRMDFPIGIWGGRLGIMLEKDFTAVARGMKFPLVKAGIAAAEAYDSVCQAMIPEYAQLQEIFPFFVAFGAKP